MAATEQRILDAADEILGERGYDGMSVRDVAERAGVNKALVFYYYGSKAELFERVLERYYGAHRAALENAFTAGGTLRARLLRTVDAYFDFISEHRRYARLIQQQVAGGGQKTLIQKNLAPLYEWTTAAISEIAPEDGPLAAKHFFLTFSGVVINYFTYAPILEPLWGGDPLSGSALAERKEHIRWILDTLLNRLQRDQRTRKKRLPVPPSATSKRTLLPQRGQRA